MSDGVNSPSGNFSGPTEQGKTSEFDETHSGPRAADGIVAHTKRPFTTPGSAVQNAAASTLTSGKPSRIFEGPSLVRGQVKDRNMIFPSAQEPDGTTSKLPTPDSFASLFADGIARPSASPAFQTSDTQAIGGVAQQLPSGTHFFHNTAPASHTQTATLPEHGRSFPPLPVSFVPGAMAGDLQRQVAEMPTLTPRLIGLLQAVLREDLDKQTMEEIRSTLPSNAAAVVANFLRQVEEMPKITPRIRVLLRNVMREEAERRAKQDRESGYGEDDGAEGSLHG